MDLKTYNASFAIEPEEEDRRPKRMDVLAGWLLTAFFFFVAGLVVGLHL